MKTIFVLLISFMVESAFATAVAPDRARCIELEAIAQNHRAWKTDFDGFMSERDTYSLEDQFKILNPSLNKLLGRMNDIKRLTAISPPAAITKEALGLYDEILDGKITHQGALGVLRPGLGRLSDVVDTMLSNAQVQHKECNITPATQPTQRSDVPGSSGVG